MRCLLLAVLMFGCSDVRPIVVSSLQTEDEQAAWFAAFAAIDEAAGKEMFRTAVVAPCDVCDDGCLTTEEVVPGEPYGEAIALWFATARRVDDPEFRSIIATHEALHFIGVEHVTGPTVMSDTKAESSTIGPLEIEQLARIQR